MHPDIAQIIPTIKIAIIIIDRRIFHCNMLLSPYKSPGKPTGNGPSNALHRSRWQRAVFLFITLLFPVSALSEPLPIAFTIPTCGKMEVALGPDPLEMRRLKAVGRKIEPSGPLPMGTGTGPEISPDESDLLLAAADRIYESGASDEAWELIARAGCVSDLRFASRILKFGISAGKYDETLVILHESDNKSSWTESEWRMIAEIYERIGRVNLAVDTIHRKVKDRVEYLRLQARQQLYSENIAEAIFYQEQYINLLNPPVAKAWMDLATLYLSLGRRNAAAKAVQEARQIEQQTKSTSEGGLKAKPEASPALP
jgi:hypothetical protein